MTAERSKALAVAGVVWDDDGATFGFQIGKSAALLDWQHKREAAEFQRLVWRLQARNHWANKNPESKARIQAYRRQWAIAHPQRVKEIARRAKAKYRANPENRQGHIDYQRARRAAERKERRALTVFTCEVCGTQWSPLGRLPARPPKYCLPNGYSCRSKAGWLRKKHGDAWRDQIPRRCVVWPPELPGEVKP